MAGNKRKGDREGTSVRGDKAQHNEATQAPIDRLATETRALIASFLPRTDAAKLALVSRSWNGPAEQKVWRMLHMDGTRLLGSRRYRARTPEDIDEQWRELERALIARPLRYTYIRILTVTNTGRTRPTMRSVLCRLRGLTYLRHIGEIPRYKAQALFLASVQARLLVPGLVDTIRVLDIELPSTIKGCSHDDLGIMLAQMRELVELRLLAYLDYWLGTRRLCNLVITDREGKTPLFPKLRKLHLLAKNWTALVPTIASRAPLLEEFSTSRRSDIERRWPLFENPAKEFWSCTIRHLRLMEHRTTMEFFKAVRGVESWLPCLESLCCTSEEASRPLPDDSMAKEQQLQPHLIATYSSHPALKALALRQLTPEIHAYHAGMAPSNQPWWPKKCYLEEHEDPLVRGDPDWKRNGDCFHMPTFTNHAQTLYHARCEYRKAKFSWRSLCAHIEDYARPYSNLSRDSQHSRAYYGDELQGWLQGTPAAPDGWLDLTLFEGYPLPHCLLESIYTVILVERCWQERSRCDRLPDEAWKLLSDWRQAIED